MHPRKVGSTNPALALSGQVSRVSLADLFSTLESRGRSATVRFDTVSGEASVWFVAGQLVNAEMGVLTGEAALYRILSLNQGAYEVSHEYVDRPRVIQDSVAALMAKRSKRAARWEDLVFGGPAIDAVPVRPSPPLGEPENADARRLLRLIDGRRSVLEILDESRLDPVQALEVLNSLQQQGHYVVEPRGSWLPPRPDPAQSREVRARVRFDGVEMTPPRSTTLLGMSPASSAPPPAPPPSDGGAAAGVRTSDRERARAETLMGSSVNPSWLEPPATRPPPGSTPPDSGPAIIVQAVPDESGLTETQLRSQLDGDGTLSSFPPNSGWPSLEITEEDSDSVAVQEPPRPSTPPSFFPSSTSGLLVPGALVGPYRVLFRLANSAESSVYLCREAEHGSVRNLFSLKIFDQSVETAETLHVFAAAAEAAGELAHPNILHLLGTGTFESRPLILSEYVDGCSLAALLKRHASDRPPRLIVALLFDALRGLQAAHELSTPDGDGLIHGDLNPRDLLLGLDGTCKVSDLAASRALRAIHSSALSRDPVKLAHLSPERLLGQKIDARSDVFSLGVILYEALTGVDLFGAPTAEAVRARVLEGSIERPSQVGLRAPEVFDTVCLRALERDPEQRYQSAREMLSALEQAALMHDTLASSIEVADWISSAFGRELELRRLSILDASRRSRSRAPGSMPPPPVQTGAVQTLDALPVPAGVPSRTLPSAVLPSGESTALAVRPKPPTELALSRPPTALALSRPLSDSETISLDWEPERAPSSRLGLVALAFSVIGVLLVGAWWLFFRSAEPLATEPAATGTVPTIAPVATIPKPELPKPAVVPPGPVPAISPSASIGAAEEDAAGAERSERGSSPARRSSKAGRFRGANPVAGRPPVVHPSPVPASGDAPVPSEADSVAAPPREQPAGDSAPEPESKPAPDPEYRYGI